MGETLIETEVRIILNQGKSQGINEAKREMALRMLQDGELSIDKIAKYSGLKVSEVQQLAELQNV